MAKDKIEKQKLLDDARAALAMLKDITPTLEKWSAAPPPEERIAALPGTRTALAFEDAYERVLNLRSELSSVSNANLKRMIDHQLVKGAAEGQGIPLSRWASSRGTVEVMQNGFGPDVIKLLDTAGGSALIRQDLEPLLYVGFVRRFPLWERITRQPSNGLVHAFNRVDAAPDATFISELGVVPSGSSTYTRATTNIAIAAIQVGVGLKQQFAVAAGGMGWSPEQEEISNGLVGLARRLQRTLLSGNDSVPGKIATDPEGLYDKNAFTGLRSLVPSDRTLFHDTSNFTLNESMNILDGFLSETGGRASIITMDARDQIRWMNELQAAVRYVLPTLEVIPGLPGVPGISLGNSGQVAVLPIPGDEVGHYTSGGDRNGDGSASDVRDAYMIDESVVSIPWLGAESPTVLDIPMGVSGTLTHVFILFQMCGLAVKVPHYIAKLQIPQ